MKTPLSILSVITCFILQIGYAQCDPIELLLSSQSSNPSTSSRDFGQFFRTTCSSRIQSITVWTSEVTATTNFNLVLYATPIASTVINPTIPPEDILYTQSGTWSASTTETAQTIVFDTPFPIVSGNDYMFMIEGAGTNVGYRLMNNSIDNFPNGGHVFRLPDSNNTWFGNNVVDMKFSIDTEPFYETQCNTIAQQLIAGDEENLTNEAGQLITPFCDGKLRSISFWTRTIESDVNLELKILEGVPGGYSGIPSEPPTELYSQVLPTWSASPNIPEVERKIIFDTPFDVEFNQPLVFLLRNPNGDDVFLVRNTANPYPYGGLQRRFGNNWIYLTSTDLKFAVEYLDEIPPEVGCKNITINLDEYGQASITASQVDNGSFDAGVGIDYISVSPNTFDCDDVNTVQNVTLTAFDLHGNSSSCTSQVTINDYNNVPIIENCPSDIVVQEVFGTCGATVNYTPPTFLAGCETPTIEFTGIESGEVFPLGDTLVTYTATNSQNQSTPCSFTVTVEESVAPVFNICPSDIIQCNPIVNYTLPVATDNCGTPTLEMTSGLPSGASFPVGNTLVTYTATDSRGNTTDCSFTVTIEDNEAPVFIDCPTDIVQCDPVVTYVLPIATDNCGDPIVELTNGFQSGISFPIGTTQVIYTATDPIGNTTLCSFNVTVGSGAPGFISCPDDITVSNEAGTCGAVVNYPLPTVEDCYVRTLEEGLAPGSVFPAGTTLVRYKSTDPTTGSTAFCSFNVIVEDTEAPAAICQNISLELDQAGEAYLNPQDLDNGSTDNCPLTYSINGSTSSVQFLCNDIGVNTVELTVTDPSGNTKTCAAQVTVEDNLAPIFTDCPDTINIDLATQSAVVNYTVPSVTDNCAQGLVATRTQGLDSGSAFPMGTTRIVYEVTDTYGNTAACSFKVKVFDSSKSEFITEWTTTVPGESVTIPIDSGYTYNYTIDWGDGTVQTNQSTALTHTYANPGQHIVKISGDFPSIRFGDSNQLTKLLQWGGTQWRSLDFAFSSCINMEYAAEDVPDISYSLINFNMRGVFLACANLGSPNLNGWDFNGSEIRILASFFEGSNFNGEVDQWDVSQIRNFSGMFARSNFNGDISNWNITTAAQDMRQMFNENPAFNQDISSWDVSNVIDMSSMFSEARSFNQDISAWDVGNVITMNAMFYDARSFNQDLGGWNVSNVNNFLGFISYSGLSRENLDNLLIGWNALPSLNTDLTVGAEALLYCNGAAAKANLESTYNMTFIGATENCAFVTTWQTSSAFESITIPTNFDAFGQYTYFVDWGDGTIDNTVYDDDATHTYENAGLYTVRITGSYFPAIYFNNSGDKDKIRSIEAWGPNSWFSMENAFYGCSNLVINANDVPDLVNATSMQRMFEDATAVSNGVSNWDVSTITNMSQLFKNATSFSDDISNWDISNVADMSQIFNGVTIASGNYDAILLNWADRIVNDNVNFDAGNSQYCYGTDARLQLELNSSWTITDLGSNCSNTFNTEWATTQNNEAIEIGLNSDYEFDFIIDWGDGSVERFNSLVNFGNPRHTYVSAGNYIVKISGVLPGLTLNIDNSNANSKILDVQQWGDNLWRTMEAAFAYSENLDVSASDTPNLSQVTSMFEMFRECSSLIGTSAFNNWDISNVINIGRVFRQTPFNQPISNWDLSKVEDMEDLFFEAVNFNQDISAWNTSNVQIMEGVFEKTEAFNQDISTWDTSNVVVFKEMFEDALAFNQDLSNWDTSKGATMWRMFENATAFNQNLGNWDIGHIVQAGDDFLSMEEMLIGSAMSVANYDATLIGWATDGSGVSGDGIDDIPLNIQLDASSAYCLSEADRQDLITNYGWQINDGGLDANCSIIKISPRIVLQGAALNPNIGEEALMRDDLRTNSLIPQTSPYDDGLVAEASVFTMVGTEAIVDWVWVELRDKTDHTIVVDAQSALLQRDGDIVAADGLSPLSFAQAVDSYYIVIKHRNHIGVITAAAQMLNETPTLLDIASDSALVQGGANALVLLPNGNYAMYTGDYDGNTQIQNTDAIAVIQLIGASGYDTADMDVNSQVQNTDVNTLIYPNIGRGQQFSRSTIAPDRRSVDMTLHIANAQITNDGYDDFYEADILISSTVDFYLGSGQLYLDYNAAAFGNHIASSGALSYGQPDGSLLGYAIGTTSPAYRDFIKYDNTNTRVSLSFQQGMGLGSLQSIPELRVTEEPKVLFHIKIRYLDVNEAANICFYTDGIFQDQFFTACGGDTTADCFSAPGIQITNDSYDCSEAIEGTLSITDYEDQAIALYPNPTNNSFYIRGVKGSSILRVYDINGKLLLEQKVVKDQAVSMARYDEGVYLVEVLTESSTVIRRLVKKQ